MVFAPKHNESACFGLIRSRVPQILRIIKRIIQFLIIGTLCLVLHLAIQQALSLFMPAYLANAIGFLASAQLNFVLSYHITWGDSERVKGARLFHKWTKFHVVVLIGLVVNSIVFSVLLYAMNFPSILAVIAATALSTCSTFVLNHFFAFRSKGDHHAR